VGCVGGCGVGAGALIVILSMNRERDKAGLTADEKNHGVLC
jgi:hypothetical protein